MKNHTDVLVFYTAICAGASQISSDGRGEIAFANFSSPRRIRSGKEIIMVKSMMRQYMRAYNWSHVKAQIKKCPQGLFFPVWLVFIMAGTVVGSGVKDTVVSLLVYLPMMHIFFAGILHPTVGLDKMMYLCPMDAARRRKFVYQFYFWKIGLDMVPALVGILAMFFFAPPGWLAVLGIVGNDLLAASMLPWAGDHEDQWEMTKEMLYKLAAFDFVEIGNVILTDILIDGGESQGMEIVPLGILFLIELPLCIHCRKFIKAELEHAVEYENT